MAMHMGTIGADPMADSTRHITAPTITIIPHIITAIPIITGDLAFTSLRITTTNNSGRF